MSPITATASLPDRFRVTGHVADGGMASVWAAEDRTLGRTVAIKLLAERFAGDADAVRRFQREARAAARLSGHPHVVTIFDVGEHEGRPFIVMEHMPGGSLAQRLHGDRRPRRADVLRWLREAAAALDFAHERGVVHRDVKPGNLLLDDRGRLGVSDFGIARAAFDTTLTATGQLLGTAAYLSPEQAGGEPARPASDRYALAVVAYELLTGRRPFAGGSLPAQARQHLEADPLPPSAHPGADLPPDLDRVLLRGLEKEPEARWPTAVALVDAVAAALGEDGAAPTAPLPQTAVTRPLGHRDRTERESAIPIPAAPPRRYRGRRSLLPVAAALGALAVIAVAVAALGGGGESARRQAQRPAVTSPPGDRGDRGQARQASGESVATLNDRGYRLIRAGRPREAIAPLQAAVDRCGESTQPVCAYALYNLGHALRLAGRPEEAIPILERRLQIPNQQDVVRRELELARQQAGTTPAPSGEEDDDVERPGHGKGRGKGKKHKDG